MFVGYRWNPPPPPTAVTGLTARWTIHAAPAPEPTIAFICVLAAACSNLARMHVQITVAPEDGVYVDGLHIDGARWDPAARCLTDAAPGSMYSALPIVHFRPSTVQDTPPKHYMCPLYKNSKRAGLLSTTGQSTNFVLYVDLPMKAGSSQDYWVLQGVALLCMLDT